MSSHIKRGRSDTWIYLVGHPTLLLAHSSLPTTKEVFLDCLARRDEAVVEGKILSRRDFSVITTETVINLWKRANLPTLSLEGIIKRVLKVWDEWKDISKSRKQTSAVHQTRRQKFTEKLESLFDISPPDWRDKVRSTRHKVAAEEDIAWLEKLMKGEKTGGVGGVDMKHQKRVLAKENKLKSEQIRATKEKERKCIESKARKKIEFHSGSESEECSEGDAGDDVTFRCQKRVKRDYVTLTLPANLSQHPIITETADRLHLSHRDLYQTLGAITAVGGIDSEDLKLSKTSVRRNRIKNRKARAEMIVREMSTKSASMILTLHWDGKIMADLTREVKDRLAISISGYPHFIEGKLITVADITNGKGRTMADKILQELQNADLLHHKYGAIVFDTTSSNTGNLLYNVHKISFMIISNYNSINYNPFQLQLCVCLNCLCAATNIII